MVLEGFFVNMYQSIVKTSVMLLLIGNSISFGMIIRYKNEEDKKRLPGSVKRVLNRKYPTAYPMTVDEVLRMVEEEDKKLKPNVTTVPKVLPPLKDSDKTCLKDLFDSVEVSKGLDFKQRPLFKKFMLAIAQKDYNNLSDSLLKLKQSLFTLVSLNTRFSLSYKMYSWAAKDRHCFELVAKSDPFTADALLTNHTDGRRITLLDLMIEDQRFNQRNIETYKQNGGLTAEEIGKNNLRALYKSQDPEFVLQCLVSDAYLPVLFVDNSPIFIENNQKFEFYVVNPYEKSFYTNSDMQWINNKRQIVEIGTEQLEKHLTFALRKKVQQSKKTGPIISYYWVSNITSPLFYAVLFGDDNDVLAQLNNSLDYAGVYMAARVAISSPSKHNNALELVLQKLQSLAQEGNCADSYNLLLLAAKNKNAFELVSKMNCYHMNWEKWRFSSESETDNKTNLDRMIRDNKNFDMEHIKIFRSYGGMTSKEVDQYNELDKTFKNLSNRQTAIDVGLSYDEQVLLKNRFNSLSFAKT